MRAWPAALATVAAAAALLGPAPEEHAALRAAIARGRGVVVLPPGRIALTSELLIPPGSAGLEIRGSAQGTVLWAAPEFDGRALIRCERASNIALRGFTVDGNRAALEQRQPLPPSNRTFAAFYRNNGILAVETRGIVIAGVRFREVAGYPVLISRSRDVLVERAVIENSGSRTSGGRNNASGGILLEDGASAFTVRRCELRNVSGNGIWTHSRFDAPRNRDGVIEENRFDTLARDAIQVGHAVNVRVERNSGARIGYPVELVDMESGAIPVAIDTAGDTERCLYADNRFEEINGKCIDLDGFHHGEIRGNRFVNRGPPEAYPYANVGIVFNDSHPHTRSDSITVTGNRLEGLLYTGMFVIGPGHTIVNNRFLNLNRARCNDSRARFGCYNPAGDPQLLETGIYLGRGVLRPNPARNSRIENNRITGYKMGDRCIAAAPGVELAGIRISGNQCSE